MIHCFTRGKMYVRAVRQAPYDYMAIPSCELSRYAAMFAGVALLTPEQIKILELMGFEILMENNTTEEHNE